MPEKVWWGVRRDQLRRQEGQAIMFVMISLALLFVISLVVVDGANAFAQRRMVQNAADAIALAAAQSLQGDATCNATCVAVVNKYYTDNVSSPNPALLHRCDSTDPTDTNCYAAPYIDTTGRSWPGRIEIRLKKKNIPTFFGGAVGSLFHTVGITSFDASARAVGLITGGAPPPLTFAALNQNAGCDNHTLVIRSSGRLTVNNNIYVDSCNGLTSGTRGDGFDIFGTGGCIMAKDIFVHGGWETHAGLSVYIPVPGSPCSGTPCPLLTDGGNPPTNPPGCPHTGVAALVDPFAGALQPPALDPTGVPNNTCSFVTPCYNVSEFNHPYWLDASLSSAGTNVVADQTTGVAAGTVPAFPFYISIDGERMQATGNGAGGSLPGKAWTVTRGALGTVAAAHNEPAFDVIAERRGNNVVTLITSAPHGLHIGDEVRVNLADASFDGVFTVTEIPDDETAANPVQFEFVIPGGAKTDIGIALSKITSARRASGIATITLNTAWAAGAVNVGDRVVVDISTGHTDTANICTAGFGTCADTSFNETLEDGVTVASIAADRKSFTYAQPGLPDTAVTIQKIGRFDGATTIVTAANDDFNKNTNPATDFVVGANKTISYPPDFAFSGTFPLATVTGTNTFTYANNGCAGGCPDVGFTVASTKNITYVARWNNHVWITTNGALGGINDNPPSRVEISVASGSDTSVNGVFNLDLNSLTNANLTFTYSQTGPNSAIGSPITVSAVARNKNVATLTVTDTSTLNEGDLVIVNTSDTSFNNGGNPVEITKIASTTTFQYDNTGSNLTTTTATGDVKLIGGPPPAASTAKRRAAGQLTVNGSGDPCDPASAPLCTASPWADDRDTSSGAFGFNSIATCTACAVGPLFEIFKADPTPVVASSRTTPAEYTVSAGVTKTLDPGTYYGGICIGSPMGASCGSKVGGTCATSAATGAIVTMNPGIYIMAGGGFFLCGGTTLIAKGVMIYNTVDSAPLAPTANAKAAELDQVKLNTNGEVSWYGARTAPYKGVTIFQGPDPANIPGGNLAIAPATKCDGRQTNLTDIALLHMGTNGLGNPAVADSGISGTIYAPEQYALFRDTVSGTNTLAVVTGCIFIDGATSTFNFDATPGGSLAGVGWGLSE